MVAFTFRMDTGYPGSTNRNHDSTVVAETINTTTPPASYGIAVAMDAATGTIRTAASADLNTAIWGFYVRPWITQGGGVTTPVNDPLYTSTPPTSGVGNVMRRGFMTVKLNAASPAAVKGAPANVWTGAVTAGNPAGGVTAAAPAAGSVLAIGATFLGPADANNITEIAYNI